MNGKGDGSPNGHASSDHSSPKSPPFPYDTPAEPSNPTVVPREILERFHFTFLIRHPKFAIPSYYRCCIPPLVERTGFNPFMPSEAGYDELRALFDYCKETGLVGPKVCGREEANNIPYGKDSEIEICVIDADDLLDDPEGVLRKYCTSIGLTFEPEMLNWDNEEDHVYAKEAFEKWNGFHDDAIYSKDLKPRAHVSHLFRFCTVFPSVELTYHYRRSSRKRTRRCLPSGLKSTERRRRRRSGRRSTTTSRPMSI